MSYQELLLKAKQKATRPVSGSQDLQRVLALPWKKIEPAQIEEQRQIYQSRFAREQGTMQLFPLQAQALYEIEKMGGLFAPMGVGSGKTLVSVLAFTLLNSKRPVLVMPGGLKEKTLLEVRGVIPGNVASLINRKECYEDHFRIHKGIQYFGYEFLSTSQGQGWDMFQRIRPDVIVFDEAHKLKNMDAGITRKIFRFLSDVDCKTIMLSGSFCNTSINDFSHIAEWALGDNSPLPISKQAVQDWSAAIDEKPFMGVHRDPGALRAFEKYCDEPTSDERARIRIGFSKRLNATFGVVASKGQEVPVSLNLKTLIVQPGAQAQKHFETLRNLWEDPDGNLITGATIIDDMAQQLATGFHYYLDPRPSEEYFNSRKSWNSFVREKLQGSDSLDTEGDVKNWVRESKNTEGEILLDRWLEEKEKCTSVQRVRWHDDALLTAAKTWSKKNKNAIIFTKHRAFGKRLATELEVPYCGEGGLSEEGVLIDDYKGKSTVVASISANKEGRNLQAWNKSLVVHPPSTGPSWEQLIGRMHRQGQQADEVQIDIFLSCYENCKNFDRARKAAHMTSQLFGGDEKLKIATIVDIEKPALTPAFQHKNAKEYC